MSTFQAFAIRDYGSPTVFEELLIVSPPLKEHQVRIRVEAFGINPYDVALRQGAMQAFRTLKFPYVLGGDVSGEIIEIGSAVTDFTVGDRVIAHALHGAYSEELVVSDKRIILKPEQMSAEIAAGLPTVGITAYNLLFHLLDLKAGDTLMIEGASGGVGASLVQLAKRHGYRVLASASSKNQEYVESLGVDDFAAYDQSDVGELFREQADVVIDATKGGRGITAGLKIVKPAGTFVALNDLPDEKIQASKPQVKYLQMGPSKDYSDQEALLELATAFEASEYQLLLSEVFPFELDSVIAAHERLEGHPPAGKLVVSRINI